MWRIWSPYPEGVSVDRLPTPLHEMAARSFPFGVFHGFTLFAPPDSESLIGLAASASGILVAVNAEKLANAHPSVVSCVNANLGYPDGMGAVLLLRRIGIRAPRIAGADLWLQLVSRLSADRRFFLIGGTRPVIEATAGRLRGEHPGMELAYRDGYLTADDVERLKEELAQRRPDVVLVGMGSPRQELLMDELYDSHPALYMGLGGSFDVFVGRKQRAPGWVQRIGLEWAYQFVRNPRRLHRLPSYLKFAWMLGSGRI
jgi:UDP-N-acetyl-D-mannosaminouronate:lipid I N-acetyl-D-mannosaminouronosyltransferase